MRRILGNKESTLERKRRKKKKIKESSCHKTNTKKMYSDPFRNSDFIEKKIYLLNMDVVYCDDFLKEEFFTSNEYIVPSLTKHFETTVLHAAIPATTNNTVEFNKKKVANAEENTGAKVKAELGFKKKQMSVQCGDNFSANKKNENHSVSQIINVDKAVDDTTGKGAGLSKVKNNTKNKVNEKEKNKNSKTVEVFRIGIKNLHYTNESTKKKKKVEIEKEELFLIEQNMPQKKEFPIYDDNLLNKKYTCNIYSHFCDILNFFNCNLGETQLNNGRSNDTELTLYQTNVKNESCDTEVPTVKSSVSLNKGVTENIDNSKNTENENGENKWNVENGPNQQENVELTNSEISYREEHLTENTCSDGCNIETRNSDISTERGCTQTQISSSLLPTERTQLATHDSVNTGDICTNEKKETETAVTNGTVEKLEKPMSTETEMWKRKRQRQRHRQRQKQQQKKKKEKIKGHRKSIHTLFNASSNANHVNKIHVLNKKKAKEQFVEQVDENIVFIQIENFSQKIEEYIADEKIFRAQKLIEHVKKYTEFYIDYFKENGSKPVVDKLLKYYKENCVNNNNVKYNINTLKSNIILHFLNFFRLTEMVSILNEYCYYFSVDPLISHDVSDSTSEHNDITRNENDKTSLAKVTEETALKDISPSCSNSDLELQRETPHFFNFSKEIDMQNLNKNKVVIVDKLYHHQFVTANIVSNNKVFFDDPSTEEQADINSSQFFSNTKRHKHISRFIKRYSRRLKKFRKHKRNKEGWIKENDKFLDLWYQVDNENNISVHVRAKLPYEINRILCILNETDLSVNWAPFLTSAQKIKHLSKASAIIAQLYEYPVIGKKESIMYCLGANALEELGCIILCCIAPPDFTKDIIFYENMCEQLQINKNGEIIKTKDIPINAKKTCTEVTFFDFLMPQATSKIDRQRAADLCFLLYPLEEGKATVLELFLHFEVDFKYTPIKMVTYFIKKIVRNMYENIVKCCKNYENKYSHFLHKNKEFYDWLDKQIQRFLKNKNDIKLIDTISLRSYNEPETNE